MKILNTEQITEADKVTIQKQQITSEDLMERAASRVFDEIHSKLQNRPVPIKVFCGTGNNGGDGLVISRLLKNEGYEVITYIINYSRNRSKDFLANYDKQKNNFKVWPVLLKGEEDFPPISANTFVIDAIFGIGLNRPPEGWVANLINHINKSGAFILAVDIPSGLGMEKIPSPEDAVIRANFTLTFQTPKLVFFLPETANLVGVVKVLDIGLDEDFIAKAPAIAELVGKQEAYRYYKPRQKFSHKGTYGHSLIIGGSYGKIGSISLTATAALRTGAGMVTIYAPKCGYDILQTTLPEAMVITDPGEKELENITFDLEPSVICFGMGAGTTGETMKTFEALLQRTEKPMVIDADGLNMLSKNEFLKKLLPKNSILTPHPKELERLIGSWKDDFEKLEKAKEFSRQYEVVMVLKDAHTLTVFKDQIFVNDSGNPGMATAGAGDVLAGIIAGLVSQAYDPLTAAVFGVYLHGRAGDIAAAKRSFEGTIAGDISMEVGAAIKDFFENDSNSSSG